jgi:hypothetical protein
MCSNDEILWSISPPERIPNGKFEWETCFPLPLFVIFPRLSWGVKGVKPMLVAQLRHTAPGHDEAGRAKSFCGSNQPGQWKACLWMVGICRDYGKSWKCTAWDLFNLFIVAQQLGGM